MTKMLKAVADTLRSWGFEPDLPGFAYYIPTSFHAGIRALGASSGLRTIVCMAVRHNRPQPKASGECWRVGI